MNFKEWLAFDESCNELEEIRFREWNASQMLSMLSNLIQAALGEGNATLEFANQLSEHPNPKGFLDLWLEQFLKNKNLGWLLGEGKDMWLGHLRNMVMDILKPLMPQHQGAAIKQF